MKSLGVTDTQNYKAEEMINKIDYFKKSKGND